ncbi:MAG: hypothetical protein JWM62_540 [Frankiales bacterium]|nr:hypothetical protein [Frankiales bacterium]
MWRSRHRAVVGLCAVALVAAGFLIIVQGDTGAPASGSGRDEVTFTQPELDAVAKSAAEALEGVNPGLRRLTKGKTGGPVFARLRSAGVGRGSGWARGPNVEVALREAIRAARSELAQVDGMPVDTVELAFSHTYKSVDIRRQQASSALIKTNVGVLGLELAHGSTTRRFSPTWMLSTNRDFEDVLDVFAAGSRLSLKEVRRDAKARTFEAQQVLVRLKPEPQAVLMERGNTYVPVEAVTPASVSVLADGMSKWMLGAVHPEGRLTYKYWPSRGVEAPSNNMIRQWMGTTALGRINARMGGVVQQTLRRNVGYNLANNYEEVDGLGLVVEADGIKVKLGAVALAARALVEQREQAPQPDVELRLRRTVDRLWRGDGSFRTWYAPADVTGQENFYPGEALYLWSGVYARDRDPELLRRFMLSFGYYRAWHLREENRNPAFVPWHTQAYFEVWQVTQDDRLRAFIFEMNDWLIDLQEWEGAAQSDTAGRFYDPRRAHFGAPHASATGVYLEGLVDAHALAVAVGDRERAEKYRRVVVRGLRNVMQLQFDDDIDQFYVTKKDRVRGGIRTEVYDNEIRVDNVQHNLMATLKVLARFKPSDYRP